MGPITYETNKYEQILCGLVEMKVDYNVRDQVFNICVRCVNVQNKKQRIWG